MKRRKECERLEEKKTGKRERKKNKMNFANCLHPFPEAVNCPEYLPPLSPLNMKPLQMNMSNQDHSWLTHTWRKGDSHYVNCFPLESVAKHANSGERKWILESVKPYKVVNIPSHFLFPSWSTFASHCLTAEKWSLPSFIPSFVPVVAFKVLARRAEELQSSTLCSLQNLLHVTDRNCCNLRARSGNCRGCFTISSSWYIRDWWDFNRSRSVAN